MVREILLGIAIAFTIFAAFLGINVMPIVFLMAAFLLLSHLIENRGLVPANKNIVNPESEVSFEDIGGQNTAISELKEALDFVVNKEKIAQMGIPPIKGILLIGPPGTGKTLLAKAAAKYTNSSFIATSGNEFIEMYAGVGALKVRRLF
ncbi:ATP-dependent Zn protease [Caldanaerobacter subterraneus subsp. pacificus DSM 12653]|uniref:ATP-dependent Zn protease n=1 Tax=Caldanaerobacter subterraneus subsp. pacificus DSM 12653 TaxID=391606 RepID=A0A0F5PR17_9THEO|nr:AAA family ATPase [Caldanaerobacter subterraneus]KKC30851.1 ATP-dependent Zn protease [Caldanaerobacter subterraneus subsp. pacificus DSM 12653]